MTTPDPNPDDVSDAVPDGMADAAGEVHVVELSRAFADPIIAYRDNTAPAGGEAFADAIPRRRMALVRDAPAGERVALATWPEVAVYCSSASLVDQAWARGTAARIYKLAFKRSLDQLDGDIMSDHLEQQIGLDALELSDQEKRKAGKLRRKIKRTRDQHFLNHHYDEWGVGVPKARWKPGPVAGKLEDVEP